MKDRSVKMLEPKQLFCLDSSFLEDIEQIMKELNLNSECATIKQKLEKFKKEKFPAYLLMIELNRLLLEYVIKKGQFRNSYSRLALMQQFLLNPLQFLENYKQFSESKVRKSTLRLLNAPRNVFWNWADDYTFIARQIFSIVSFHPEGLTKEEIIKIASNQKISQTGALRELKENSFLRKHYFIILESGKYYPFFSPKLSKESIAKAEEKLLKQIDITSKLLFVEYKMPKYHIDFVVKVLKGAENLSRILKEFIDQHFHPSDPKIVKILLRTNRKKLSRFTISRVEERFEALKLDGIIEKDDEGFYVTNLGKNLIYKNLIILTLNYSKVMLLEEKIVKKGHSYWDAEKYLEFMKRLGFIISISSNTGIYVLTKKGEDALKRKFDLDVIAEDILWQMA